MANVKKSDLKDVKKDPTEEVFDVPESALEPEISQTREVAPEDTEEIIAKPTDEDALRKEIEGMDLDDSQAAQAQDDAQQVATLKEEEKLEKLLTMAKSKGVIHAIKVAQKMNDAYLLDRLHDTLIKEGLYKAKS